MHFALLLVKGLSRFFEDVGNTFADWMTFPGPDWPKGHSLTQCYFHPRHSHGEPIHMLHCEVSIH